MRWTIFASMADGDRISLLSLTLCIVKQSQHEWMIRINFPGKIYAFIVCPVCQRERRVDWIPDFRRYMVQRFHRNPLIQSDNKLPPKRKHALLTTAHCSLFARPNGEQIISDFRRVNVEAARPCYGFHVNRIFTSIWIFVYTNEYSLDRIIQFT